MNIMAVDCDKIDGIWSEIVPNIRKVLKTQEKHNAVTDNILSIEGTREHIKKGHGQMLVIHDDNTVLASLMVEVLNTEVGRSLNITTLGGERIYEWNMMLLQTLKNIAKHHNCDDIRIYMVRPGWVRALRPYKFMPIGNREYGGKEYPCLSYNMRGIYSGT